MIVNWKKVALFYGVTFALTHALSLGYVLTGGTWVSPSSFAAANALMLCPALVALGLQRFVFREPIVAPFGLHFPPNRWFLLAWLSPPLVMLAALAFSLILPGAKYANAAIPLALLVANAVLLLHQQRKGSRLPQQVTALR
jgi:CAAX protease family protein